MWNSGKNVYLLVCMHCKGVCLVEKYDKMDGRYFTSFVHRQFPKLFAQNSKTPKKLWIQDGDPSTPMVVNIYSIVFQCNDP